MNARIVMLSSLLLAVTFAIAHDRFYSSLQGNNTSFVDQHLSTNIGTAFAFLVKTALGVAFTTVYAQILWKKLLNSELEVWTIDSLSSITVNAFHLLDIDLWRYPFLMLIALLTWTIAFSTVFPPGALSVGITFVPQQFVHHMPLVDWNGSSILVNDDIFDSSPQTIWPKFSVKSLADQVATTGDVLPLSAPANSSYTLSIIGPSLSCESQQSNNLLLCDDGKDAFDVTYLSWISTADLASPPENPSCSHPSTPASDLRKTTFLYVLTSEILENLTSVTSFTRCQIQNATYDVHFSFYGAQKLSISKVSQRADFYNLSAGIPDGQWTGAGDLFRQTINYYAVYLAVVEVLLGYVLDCSEDSLITDVPIFKTRLAFSDELAHCTLHDFQPKALFNAVPKSQGPLAPMIEDLFQNITLSLLTAPQLMPSQPIEMSIDVPTNIYHYNWQHLWLSYGIGIGACACSVLLSMLVTKASYTTKFSTFLRTAKMQDSGVDPLPKEIGRMRISLGRPGMERIEQREKHLSTAKAEPVVRISYEAMSDHTELSSPDWTDDDAVSSISE